MNQLPLGFFVLDGDWRFTHLNNVAERLFHELCGRSAEQLRGQNLWEHCCEVADSTFAKEYQQALAEQRTFELETFYPSLDRWFLFLATPADSPRCFSFMDITERKHLERDLNLRIQQLVDADRGKVEFLGHLSHEVRNALAVLSNSLYRKHRQCECQAKHAHHGLLTRLFMIAPPVSGGSYQSCRERRKNNIPVPKT